MHTNLRLGLGLLGIGWLAQAFAAAPAFQRNDSIGVVLGDPVDYHLVAAGDVVQYAAEGLPSGLTLNAATGEITGTPAEVGRYRVAVSASNADGTSTATLSIAVVDPSAGPLIYAPLEFDAYNQAQPGGDTFSCALQATGAPSTYSTTDPLPNGWMLSSNTIVGLTSQPGLFVVPVTATNTNGVGSAAITIRVHPACTQVQQTPGQLQAGNVFTVTLQFNRPVTFTSTAPYLEFSTYPNGATRKLAYVSGNGTSTFVFAYTVAADDAAGDILLYRSIQPAVNGAVSGLADTDGLTLGSTLPMYGPSSPVASIVAAAPAPTAAPAPAPVATSAENVAVTTPSSGSETTTNSAPADTSAGTAVASAPTTSAPASGSAGDATSAAPAGSGTVAAASGTTAAPATNEPADAGAAAAPAAEPVATAAASANVSGGRLLNLSARGLVTDGDSSRSFIAGFVVSGTTAKRVLVRAVGPSLASFGVQNALPNPQLRVTDGAGKIVAQSDDWSGGDTVATSTAVGAFSLPAGSRDAAVTVDLAPGTYSMQVLPNGGSGVALAEVYDADAAPSGPLLNVSSRGFVGAGENVLTAGFVVGGDAPKRVLIRGVGPSLSGFGVAGALTNPVVKVYQGGKVVAQNDDWQTAQSGALGAGASEADLRAAADAAGAFQLGRNSHDAATIVTLPPGVYSAVVSSADTGSGAALVEVYQF